MADTKIEWADKCWNPITGCSPISPGCEHCGAARMARRLAGRCGYPKNDPFRVTFHPERLDEPMDWRKPRRVLVCSMGDLFHQEVTEERISRIFGVMSLTRRHTFLVLTKRPERMCSFFNDPKRGLMIAKEQDDLLGKRPVHLPVDLPLSNVWLGVTIENGDYLWRVEKLMEIPAAKRFVNIELTLGEINIFPYLRRRSLFIGEKKIDNALDWVILGGETGPGARPMHPDWARSIRDQCRAAGVPFFMKKLSGGKKPPPELMIREFPE